MNRQDPTPIRPKPPAGHWCDRMARQPMATLRRGYSTRGSITWRLYIDECSNPVTVEHCPWCGDLLERAA